jgi:hypothetical protein
MTLWTPDYQYPAIPLGVHDGDTIHVLVDKGTDDWKKETVRLYGIDCWELDQPLGPVARDFTVDWLLRHAGDMIWTVALGQPAVHVPWLVMYSYKDRREKYGRYLADFRSPTIEDNGSLVRALQAAGMEKKVS